jgi:hypothetical protein
MTGTYTVYQLPGTAAGVAIATKGTAATLALLAKGRSRNADKTYTLRNPERRALFAHILDHLTVARILRATKGGKADAPAVTHDIPSQDASLPDAAAALTKAHSGAGNFRLDIALTLPTAMTSDDLAAALGLAPKVGARAPKDVRWLR